MKRKKRLSALAAALAAALLFSACGGAAPAAEEKTEGTVMRSESLYVKKVENLPEDFILGMDISRVLAEERSGVRYYDFDGNETDLFRLLADIFKSASCTLEAADQAGFLFDLLHGGLRTADVVPHALAGNAKLIGNLRQGQILVVMQIEALSLLVRQQLPVEIQQHALGPSAFHGARLPVKYRSLTEYTRSFCFCQVFFLVRYLRFIKMPLWHFHETRGLAACCAHSLAGDARTLAV